MQAPSQRSARTRVKDHYNYSTRHQVTRTPGALKLLQPQCDGKSRQSTGARASAKSRLQAGSKLRGSSEKWTPRVEGRRAKQSGRPGSREECSGGQEQSRHGATQLNCTKVVRQCRSSRSRVLRSSTAMQV